MWNFKNIPKSKHNKVVDLWNAQNYKDLKSMLALYKVPDGCITCVSLNPHIIDEWMTWAIHEKHLTV